MDLPTFRVEVWPGADTFRWSLLIRNPDSYNTYDPLAAGDAFSYVACTHQAGNTIEKHLKVVSSQQ